ncbi:MAG TPA: ATP-binding protein, partial [Armatimonadota bacterium]|nr:ATP-binding protein [Armatimonadota bacterium]
AVSDQGVGIPPEQLAHIFDRFHRLDYRDSRQTYGCGIGLYLVKHLVEAHGGSVSVESEVEKGSLFSFCLPLRPPDAEE